MEFVFFLLDSVAKRVHNVLVRIVSKAKLREFWNSHQGAESPLKSWYNTVKKAKWACFADVRKTFNSADTYAVEDRKYVIFNVGGNRFRVVVSANYETQIVYIAAVLTHAQYDKENWKDKL